MAKSKNNPPVTINPPNGGMRAWLTQNDPAANLLGESVSQQKEESALGQVPSPGPVTAAEPLAEETKQNEEATAESKNPVGKPVAGVGETVNSQSEVAPNASLASSQRKAKAKVGESSKAGSYPDTFFKKPVKSEDAISEVKPVRISEDSHLLLSILVSEARRKGYKLNVGDFIDNLLADHRAVHKSEVDELIANWKTRKRFE